MFFSNGRAHKFSGSILSWEAFHNMLPAWLCLFKHVGKCNAWKCNTWLLLMVITLPRRMRQQSAQKLAVGWKSPGYSQGKNTFSILSGKQKSCAPTSPSTEGHLSPPGQTVSSYPCWGLAFLPFKQIRFVRKRDVTGQSCHCYLTCLNPGQTVSFWT